MKTIIALAAVLFLASGPIRSLTAGAAQAPAGDAASVEAWLQGYDAARYIIKAKMGDRLIDSEGLETLLLMKGPDGWKIRHSHTSSRPVRRPAGE